MGDRYAFSLTTFSPSGKLVQIEHALTAVSSASNGIVIATEKKVPSILVDEKTLVKISNISTNIGMVYAGMGPDARVLLDKARKAAQEYKRVYMEEPPVVVLVKEVASIMQEYTQSGGVRPFGVSLLIAGSDSTGHSLYQVDPSGTFWQWKASAIGKNMVNAKTFLEKRFSEQMEIEDAVHTAILTLKEGMDGQLTSNMIEIGIATDMMTTNRDGQQELVSTFKALKPQEIQDYLANIA
ncbi:Protein phosphatase PP2A regulatory subunit B [Boothiomyces sp. JEL0838]|nr:Protein phosphatase PP2A regulatory subunit B [Boothiomyces sp. JEL0838]